MAIKPTMISACKTRISNSLCCLIIRHENSSLLCDTSYVGFEILASPSGADKSLQTLPESLQVSISLSSLFKVTKLGGNCTKIITPARQI